MKRLLCFLVVITMAISLIACGNKPNAAGSDITDRTDEQPADLTEEDIKIVNEINAKSTLICELYKDMSYDEEPYIVSGGEKSSATAVRIPKNDGPVRVKEIEIEDPEYNLYGMPVGTAQADFEDELIKRGFISYQQLDSMRHKSYKNGNVYVAINYDDNSNVDRIFINLLVDYNEWRGVE